MYLYFRFICSSSSLTKCFVALKSIEKSKNMILSLYPGERSGRWYPPGPHSPVGGLQGGWRLGGERGGGVAVSRGGVGVVDGMFCGMKHNWFISNKLHLWFHLKFYFSFNLMYVYNLIIKSELPMVVAYRKDACNQQTSKSTFSRTWAKIVHKITLSGGKNRFNIQYK